jgi:hypothetical protein
VWDLNPRGLSRALAVFKAAQGGARSSLSILLYPVLPGRADENEISRDHEGCGVHRTNVPRVFPREVPAMTGTDTAVRWSTIGAVTVVALMAAFVSCRHALQVVRAHGESGTVALAYPLTIDGLIYAASMVLLNSARQGYPAALAGLRGAGIGHRRHPGRQRCRGSRLRAPVGTLVEAWPAPSASESATNC